MHWASLVGGGAKRREVTPSVENSTISPGSTSRTCSASKRSKAQVSEATIQPEPSLAMDSGRKPSRSRAAVSRSSVMSTRAKEPLTSRSAAPSGSGVARLRGSAIRCTKASESVEVWKIEPRAS